MSKSRYIGFRVSGAELEVIEYLAAGQRGNMSEALRKVISDGLRLIMKQHCKPIDPYFLDPLTPEGVFDFYLMFTDAVGAELGHPGRDGKPNRYRFAKPPAGGSWERLGVTGYDVMPRNMHFSASAIVQTITAEEEGANDE